MNTLVASDCNINDIVYLIGVSGKLPVPAKKDASVDSEGPWKVLAKAQSGVSVCHVLATKIVKVLPLTAQVRRSNGGKLPMQPSAEPA